MKYKEKLVVGFLILYYAVGLGLYFFERTRLLFNILTPFSLILSFALILIFQQKWKPTTALVFAGIFVASIIVEMAGVQTGVLFGHYIYGSALGPKIWDTPILIGLNWLLLIYCTAAIVNGLISKKVYRIILASALMVLYDLVLEYVAPAMDMWTWASKYPGPRNFIMWFFLSILFHSLLQGTNIIIKNKPARYLFLIQFIFFCIIAVVFI